jgi:hypothetical protein
MGMKNYMPLIPVLKRLRQEDHKLRPAWAMYIVRPCLKIQKIFKNQLIFIDFSLR